MTIVQIGTNRAHDDVTRLVNQFRPNITKLILVEPLLIHHQAIRECYKNTPHIIDESCVTPNPDLKEISFYWHPADAPGFEVASTDKQHILKHARYNPSLREEGIVEQKTPCLTANALFDKYNLTHIDILAIDTEGMDDQIIYSLDLKKFDITSIIYEHLHIDSDAVTKYLTEKNYLTIKNWGHNGWSHFATKLL